MHGMVLPNVERPVSPTQNGVVSCLLLLTPVITCVHVSVFFVVVVNLVALERWISRMLCRFQKPIKKSSYFMALISIGTAECLLPFYHQLGSHEKHCKNDKSLPSCACQQS